MKQAGETQHSAITFGARLFAAFGVVFVLTSALLATYLVQQRNSREQVELILRQLDRKLELSAAIELATTEMQGAQRGLMLSFAMNDAESAAPYVVSYARSGSAVDAALRDFSSLAVTEEERSELAQIRQSRDAWQPQFAELVQLCHEGKKDAAYQQRNHNKQLSAIMHRAAAALAASQHEQLARSEEASRRAARQSLIVSFSIAALTTAAAIFVFAQIRTTTRRLRSIVGDLDYQANELSGLAHQVTSASQSLAQGASEQAASLEETSASAHQIQALAKSTRDSAETMLQLVNTSSEECSATGTQMESLSNSIQRIQKSSDSIAKILNVIEEIAFQTNLLALNAAVEAARAGANGASFAVVADEVRNLSHRCADAAKQTTDLIQESADSAAEGKSRMLTVAQSMQRLSASTTAIRQLVGEVSAGSQEQDRGTVQIGSALTQMEQVTQSTAGSAEETAAAAAEVSSQAGALASVVYQLRSLVGSEQSLAN